VRKLVSSLNSFAAVIICGMFCALSPAQALLDAPVPAAAPMVTADAASLDGCQMIARIDNQVVLACEVLWRVNQTIELNGDKIPPEQMEQVRQQLLKREIATIVDRKLIYDEFRRNIPAENLPRLEENLVEPFQEREIPELMKQLKVDNQGELERELTRLGSSLADVRRSFNERVIASEWIRTKIKINEEVSPEEMLEYYHAHLADFDYPAKVRWEELKVLKSRFAEPWQACAEVARMGNEAWQRGVASGVRGPAFVEVAKAKSDGPKAKEGGQHDWTTKGALVAVAIDQALFSLEIGQMSWPLESDDGFHIVRVLERQEAGRKAFKDVQPEIRDKLKEQRFQAGIEQYLTKLRRDARIWTAFTGNTTADVLLGRKPEETQTR
jgi:parvulin-like peptidyl-prolyl isomerase